MCGEWPREPHAWILVRQCEGTGPSRGWGGGALASVGSPATMAQTSAASLVWVVARRRLQVEAWDLGSEVLWERLLNWEHDGAEELLLEKWRWRVNLQGPRARCPRLDLYWPTVRLTHDMDWAVKLAAKASEEQPLSMLYGKVLGLLRLEPCRVLDGSLKTELSAEERVLWAMFDEQRGLQVFSVTHAARLLEPVTEVARGALTSTAWLHLLTSACVEKLVGAAAVSGQESGTVAELVASWPPVGGNLNVGRDWALVPALRQLGAHACLLGKGVWQVLALPPAARTAVADDGRALLPAAQRGGRCGRPNVAGASALEGMGAKPTRLASWIAALESRFAKTGAELPLTSGARFLAFESRFCKMAAEVLDSDPREKELLARGGVEADNDEPCDLDGPWGEQPRSQQIQEDLVWLQRLRRSFEPQLAIRARGRRGFVHKASALISAFFVADAAQSSADLANVVWGAVALAFPDAVQALAPLLRSLAAGPSEEGGEDCQRACGLSLPSPASLSRLRLALDLATLRLQQRVADASPSPALVLPLTAGPLAARAAALKHARFLLTDSSTQHGVDWQMTEFFSIAVPHLLHILSTVVTDTSPGQSATEALDLVCHVVLTPAGLGSGAQSLVHKMAALMWQLRLLVGKTTYIEEFCESVASITTDLGTESGLAEVPRLPIGEWLSWGCEWQSLQLDIDCPEDLGNAASDADAPNGMHAFPWALLVPGVMHICHNAASEVCANLPCFNAWFRPLLSPLARLLHYAYLRERLVETCLQGRSREASEILDLGVPMLAEWRWGTLATVLERVLSIETALRSYFSRVRFVAGLRSGPVNPEDTVEAGRLAEGAAGAIESPKFWLYARMLLAVQSILTGLSAWCERCHCHAACAPEPEESRGQRKRRFHETAARSLGGRPRAAQRHTCPLKGLCAPELAAGDWRIFISSLTAEALGPALASAQGTVSEEDVADVVRDFGIARGQVEAQLEIKLRVWSQLPHLLACLAHRSQEVVQGAAGEALRQYDMAPESQHRIADLFCSHEGFRTCMAQVACGASLWDLGASGEAEAFRSAVARFRCIPVAERSIEATHARVSASFRKAPSATPAFLSLALRMAWVREHLARHPTSLREFTALFSKLRVDKNIISVFGLSAHPGLQLTGKSLHRMLVNLVYRCGSSKFAARATGEEAIERARRRLQRSSAAAGQQHAPALPHVPSHRRALDHLRRTLRPGTVCSLPGHARQHLRSLSEPQLLARAPTLV